jgi:hypothetical protein
MQDVVSGVTEKRVFGDDEGLRRWVDRGVSHARSLPPR